MNDPTQEDSSDTETINVVPLADLTLVLLVILMVLSPMISQSMIHVAAPAVKAEKDITPQKDGAKSKAEGVADDDGMPPAKKNTDRRI